MEKCDITGKIIGWPWRVFPTLAFLWQPLQMEGCGLDSGVVLVADNYRYAKQIANFLESNTKAKIFSSVKEKGTVPLNFVAGVCVYKNGEEENAVLKFLERKDFLPILVVGGVLPMELKETTYVFRVTQADMEALNIDFFKTVFLLFENYTSCHIPDLLNIIRRIDLSSALTEFTVEKEFELLYRNLAVVGEVWRFYNRFKLNETANNVLCESFFEESRKRIAQIPQFSEMYELAQTLCALTWEYVGGHTDILIGNIDEVDGTVEMAIKNDKGILYDFDFYYVPEKLLKSICKPILETVSVDELKAMLKKQKVIVCNAEGYTIKKDYTNSFGAKKRIRTIKIPKELLVSEEQMLLEDLYEYTPKAGNEQNLILKEEKDNEL